jgi:hypothetical protein|tara:strand:- start:633 stop:1385 length:753 start_codon:yes stop_codon:yes gene_type:complete
MKKRGQVTIFIIIAIFLIAGITIYFTFRNSSDIVNIPLSIQPAYSQFISCFEETSKESVNYISKHGGYYNAPIETSIVYFSDDIPYYYLDSQAHIPSLEKIQNELEAYIEANLDLCFNKESLKEQGFEIGLRDYSISSNIKENEIKFNMLNILSISKNDETSEIKDIKINIDKNLLNLYYSSEEIIKTYSKKPGAICLSCLEDISENNNVFIEAIPNQDLSIFENDVIWFFIQDQDEVDEEFKWIFVVEQ